MISNREVTHIPSNRTDKHGKQNCINNWNKFIPDVNQNEFSHFKLKTLLKDHTISQY